MATHARAADRSEQLKNAASAAEAPAASAIVVGKDVLELLSSAMYVDPLSIYREYIQNAADAIDDARAIGLLREDERGSVAITIDPDHRTMAIRDNGLGIGIGQAPERLLAIGASAKRGTRARGFRGVGRLAGLAYGRSLTFRTRSFADDEVLEVRWDCQHLKAALRDVDQDDDITRVIQRVVTLRRLPGAEWPRHFFEVELGDIVRTKRDALLKPSLVREYLEQVAPVSFAAGFSWGDRIVDHVSSARLGDLAITINGHTDPITRPFTDRFKVSETLEDTYSELELITISDLDGGPAAVGWVLHHSYLGSITVRSRVGGLRLRVGNVQVGTEELLAEIFPESRFNGWTVGEIHVLDPRILPNARRDNFEQNVHYSNLTAQLEPIARQIARRARGASVARNQERKGAVDKLRGGGSNQTPSQADGLGAVRAAQLPGSKAAVLSQTQHSFIASVRSLAEEYSLSDAEMRDALKHV